MRFDPVHLETLVAIAEEGTFDAAAQRLRVTPSAVSQRVRALENAAGTVLVRRTTPAGVTAAGEPLLRLGRQLRLLAAEAAIEVAEEGGSAGAEVVDLRVAVNADSLLTWFSPVLGAVAGRPATALRLVIEDQAYSHDLLRRGDVLAAVTDSPEPVQGCSVEPLGALRYVAVAAPGLLDRHRHGRRLDRGALPMVVFNERDHLQDRALAPLGLGRPTVVHRVPSAADFLTALVAGLGWGMCPVLALRGGPGADLERLRGVPAIDVDLYWQRWRIVSAALDALSDDVRSAARALRRPPS